MYTPDQLPYLHLDLKKIQNLLQSYDNQILIFIQWI